MTDPLEEHYQRLADKLVQRGFATASLYDQNTKTGTLILTEAGERLKRDLRQLFAFPKTKPDDLTPAAIADQIMFLLLLPNSPGIEM